MPYFAFTLNINLSKLTNKYRDKDNDLKQIKKEQNLDVGL